MDKANGLPVPSDLMRRIQTFARKAKKFADSASNLIDKDNHIGNTNS